MGKMDRSQGQRRSRRPEVDISYVQLWGSVQGNCKMFVLSGLYVAIRFVCDCARVESAVIVTCVGPYRISEGDCVCRFPYSSATGGASCEVLSKQKDNSTLTFVRFIDG